MTDKDAIINPIKGKFTPDLPTCAIMTATEKDLDGVISLHNLEKDKGLKLMMSNLYNTKDALCPTAIIGPFVGAPYAVILLETLVAWGVEKVIFMGICGAISPDVKTGDIILPSSAIIDEGTSCQYNMQKGEMSFPSEKALEKAREVLTNKGLDFHEGPIWTFDAVFRETKEKVISYQEKGALGVEMETSALFSVGKFRDVAVCALLVVSDELSTLKWKPGFHDKRFLKTCKAVQKIATDLCGIL